MFDAARTGLQPRPKKRLADVVDTDAEHGVSNASDDAASADDRARRVERNRAVYVSHRGKAKSQPVDGVYQKKRNGSE